MVFRRFKKKLSTLDIRRNNIIALVIATVCIAVGYFIVMVSNSGEKVFDDSGSIEVLKQKVKNNPELFKKLKSSALKN